MKPIPMLQRTLKMLEKAYNPNIDIDAMINKISTEHKHFSVHTIKQYIYKFVSAQIDS